MGVAVRGEGVALLMGLPIVGRPVPVDVVGARVLVLGLPVDLVVLAVGAAVVGAPLGLP